MADAVTYQFYSQVYGGGLSESAFGLALPAASRHVQWLVGGREPTEDELESYQRAVCAAVDAFAEFDEGQVGCGGSFVRVEHAFFGGEAVRIDCEGEGATIDGIDARADVTLSSDFFTLSPGSCELSITGCSSHTTSFRERWL